MNQGDNVALASSLEGKLNGQPAESAGAGGTKASGVPSLSITILKKHDDSTEAVTKTELPNGHNNGESSEVIPRTNSSGESMDEGHKLDSLNSSTESKKSECKDSENGCSSSAASEKKGDSSLEGKTTVDESQDIFDSSTDAKNESTKINANAVMDESQNSLSLNVTESQFFGPVETEDLSNEAEEKEDDKDKTKAEPDVTKPEAKDEEKAEDKAEKSSNQDQLEESPAAASKVESAEESEEAEEVSAASPAQPPPDPSTPCTCEPSCHFRVHTVSQRLNAVCKQLGDFIKLKRRVENPDLANLLSLLTGIESIIENKPEAMSGPEPDGVFYAGGASEKRKKSISRVKFETPTPQKSAQKKPRESATPKPPERVVDFKNIKGLAVFAKWPNSRWYYPGVVEGLLPVDWKENTNVTVTFYDGLVREMKNINILPANLIPPGVILCDLDDETEMIVDSSNCIDDNNVEFKLAMPDDEGTKVDASFNKLAIKAIHMKSIKQLLEPSADVAPRKMHMVSLDNLVSGRRVRVGTNKEDSDEIIETPRKGTRKSIRKVIEESVGEEQMEEEEPTTASSSRRKRSVAADATPSKRQTKRARQ